MRPYNTLVVQHFYNNISLQNEVRTSHCSFIKQLYTKFESVLWLTSSITIRLLVLSRDAITIHCRKCMTYSLNLTRSSSKSLIRLYNYVAKNRWSIVEVIKRLDSLFFCCTHFCEDELLVTIFKMCEISQNKSTCYLRPDLRIPRAGRFCRKTIQLPSYSIAFETLILRSRKFYIYTSILLTDSCLGRCMCCACIACGQRSRVRPTGVPLRGCRIKYLNLQCCIFAVRCGAVSVADVTDAYGTWECERRITQCDGRGWGS